MKFCWRHDEQKLWHQKLYFKILLLSGGMKSPIFPKVKRIRKNELKFNFLSEFHNLAKIANILIKNAGISKNQLF